MFFFLSSSPCMGTDGVSFPPPAATMQKESAPPALRPAQQGVPLPLMKNGKEDSSPFFPGKEGLLFILCEKTLNGDSSPFLPLTRKWTNSSFRSNTDRKFLLSRESPLRRVRDLPSLRFTDVPFPPWFGTFPGSFEEWWSCSFIRADPPF